MKNEIHLILDRLINEIAAIKFNIHYLTKVSEPWEIFKNDPDQDYTTYIKYQDPRIVDLAIVSSPDFFNSLNPKERIELEACETFDMRFISLTKLIEDSVGTLPKDLKKYVGEQAKQKL